MNDSSSNAPADESAVTPFDPVNFFFALGSAVRWPIVQLLADGEPRTATDVASALHRDFDGVSKHLRLMADAGVLAMEPGEDRRYLFFSIPPANRRTPGMLDYGHCTLRMPSAMLSVAKD